MACLGGTQHDPRPWLQLRASGEVEPHDGRICTGRRLANPRTSRTKCAECPAFRGLRWDGKVANGLYPDGTPYALTPSEHEAYEAALMAVDIDDDFSLLAAWEARMSREVRQHTDGTHTVTVGMGDRALYELGDPDAEDRVKAKWRAYRQAHPDRRKRDRAAYMREYRRRRRNPLQPLYMQESESPNTESSR